MIDYFFLNGTLIGEKMGNGYDQDILSTHTELMKIKIIKRQKLCVIKWSLLWKLRKKSEISPNLKDTVAAPRKSKLPKCSI